MPDENLVKLQRKTFLKMIDNSVGSKTFNSLFVRDRTTEKEYDVLNDGTFSCAFFVSSILTLFGQIDHPHSTIDTLINKFQESEHWREETGEIQSGDVLIWEPMTFEDGTINAHIGFAFNQDRAISTSYLEKKIIAHHPTFGTNQDGSPKRKIIHIYRNGKFCESK